MQCIRICLLSFFIASFLGGCSPISSAQQDEDNLFLLGADISMLKRTEELGAVFLQENRQKDFLEILTEKTCNCFRLRLFVNPSNINGEINTLSYTLDLAKRIKQSKSKLLLNLHYSDTWAAPARQEKPSDWKNLEFEQLEEKIKSYTSSVIKQFKMNNTLPDFIQIGNEVTHGILWPEGRLGTGISSEKQWQSFTRLLKAAIEGVTIPLEKEEKIQIFIHVDQGGDEKKTRYFFDNLKKRNVPFDMIALSYYPWWHGSMQELKTNLNLAAHTYGKKIFIVETAYPYRNTSKLRNMPNMDWPRTPAGQHDFLQGLIATVQQTPKGLGAGVLYWYPEALPVPGLHPWHNGATALFDEKGNSLPAIDAFQQIQGQF